MMGHSPKGVKSPAPCWWCSRQLASWHGKKALVDGKEVVVHGTCLRSMKGDPDFKGRVSDA